MACAALCWLFFRLARKIRNEAGQYRQRIFIRETLAASFDPGDRRMLVSLSTLPDRIANLRPTLECLLNQTRPPDEIVLVVPEFSLRQQRPYEIPESLAQIPRVRIWRVQNDWGPATKFIPVIQSELEDGKRDTLVVVVDDDRIYPRDALETYAHYSRQLPNAALCFRGAAMPRSFDWRKARMIHGSRLREPKRVAVITGCGSYLIKPGFFDAALWNYGGAPRAAFYMDDIWISGCLDSRGIKKYVVPSSSMYLSVKEQSRTMTLHDVPKGRQPSNNETIAFFRKGWDVFPVASAFFSLLLS